MGKKKSKGQQQTPTVVDAVPAADDETDQSGAGAAAEDEGDDEVELLQVDVGDVVKLKQVLDEAVACAIIDGAPKLEEDYRLENAKLALMALACAFAVVAQFGPFPFPESRHLLGGCCVAYFVLSGVLQLIVSFVERDAIVVTKPPGEGGYEMKDKGLRVRTSLPRFEEFYTVTIEYQGVENSPYVKETWSVGKLFDVEGMFDEIFFEEAVEKLVKRFEKRQYDTEEKDKTDEKAKGKKKVQ